MVHLDQPVLSNSELARIENLDQDGFRACTLHTVFSPDEPLERAMERLTKAATEAVDAGCSLLILTDRSADGNHVPPDLLEQAATIAIGFAVARMHWQQGDAFHPSIRVARLGHKEFALGSRQRTTESHHQQRTDQM